MKNTFVKLLAVALCILLPHLSFSQLSLGGVPPGISSRSTLEAVPLIYFDKPDLSQLLREDAENETMGLPERMGVSFAAGYNAGNSGNWEIISGRRIWKLQIDVPDAVGIGLYFSDFSLHEDALMYIYSADYSHVIGGFSSQNNHPSGLFATEIVKGSRIIIEYSEPVFYNDKPDFTISEVLYVYRSMLFPGDNSSREVLSGACQVNTSCAEGNNWRDHIKSVVRIRIKNGFSAYWCTGTLVNNTAIDFEPFVLTADHCARDGSGDYANADDLLQWVFSFQYELPDCDGGTAPLNKTLTGAVKISSSTPTLNNGSDFYLVLLNDDIPPSYEAFYAGWDISETTSPSGVSIHHPSGDYKKISTYNSPLINDQWGSNPGTHYRVVWTETANGHGTTEGGSSGSPIFSNKGRIIGQLTGGESGCYNLTGPDFYGKMAYSWLSNGTHDSLRLQPWLDPINSGQQFINGNYNDKQVLARFLADTNVVGIGNSLIFSDISTGNPISWKWTFESGDPATSTQRDPGSIRYDRLGKFSVTLVVTNEFGTDSLTREDFITVVPGVFPNPANDYFYILTGTETSEKCNVSVIDAQGRTVFVENFSQSSGGFYKVSCENWPSGVYVVMVDCNELSYREKLIKVKP
ncbi:MAG: Lysyl [Bacteroidetes bacterium]|nr:MAG: Lysyl [Bacteroidota bacterium]